MSQIDPDQEARRLAALYSEMEDGELSELAESAFSLTDEARQALRREIDRRRLDIVMNAEIEAESAGSEDTPDYRKLVTISSFPNLHAALLAKGSLESAGIDAFIANENVVRTGWSNLVGGIKLQVAEEDAGDAEAILSDASPVDFGSEEFE